MADAPILGGTKKAKLDEKAFGADFNGGLVHDSVRAELAARRQGTHSSKTRGEVRGGGAKPWRQKGTGRARAGSSRSPIWTGGGTVFGPSPRRYTFKINRKEKRAALRSALSLHADRGSLAVFDAGDVRHAFDQAGRQAPLGLGRRAAADARRPHRRRGEGRLLVPQPRAPVGPAGGRRGRGRPRRRRVRCSSRRPRSTSSPGGPPPDGRLTGHHPAGRQREELRAGDRRQVHVPRPPRRAQDADPPGRSSSCSTSASSTSRR